MSERRDQPAAAAQPEEGGEDRQCHRQERAETEVQDDHRGEDPDGRRHAEAWLLDCSIALPPSATCSGAEPADSSNRDHAF